MTEREESQILLPETSTLYTEEQEKVYKRIQNIFKKLPLGECEFDPENLSWLAPKEYVFRVTGSFEVGSESNEMTPIIPSRRLAVREGFDRWEPEELPVFFDGKMISLSKTWDNNLFIKRSIEVVTEVGGIGQITISENGTDREYLFDDKSAVLIESYQGYARVNMNMPATRFRIRMIKSDELDIVETHKHREKIVGSFVVVPVASRPAETLTPGDIRF